MIIPRNRVYNLGGGVKWVCVSGGVDKLSIYVKRVKRQKVKVVKLKSETKVIGWYRLAYSRFGEFRKYRGYKIF